MLKKRSSLKSTYPEAEICGFSRYDSTVHFYSRVLALLVERPCVERRDILDIGCGRGEWVDRKDAKAVLRTQQGVFERVIGIDVDPEAQINPTVDEFRLISRDGLWPIDNNTIDLAICDYVLEHVDDPHLFFAELRRVLRPGGVFCCRTPNKWFYVCMAARIIPNKWHHKCVERDEAEVYPTRYECNTARRLRWFLRHYGLSGTVYAIEQEPSYLGRWPWLYRIMSYVHRMLPPMFQSTLIGFARK